MADNNFAQRFSLEVTRPSAAEIEAIGAILPQGTPVYFSAVPTITPEELVNAAKLLRRAELRARHPHRRATHPSGERPCRICWRGCAARRTCGGSW